MIDYDIKVSVNAQNLSPLIYQHDKGESFVNLQKHAFNKCMSQAVGESLNDRITRIFKLRGLS